MKKTVYQFGLVMLCAVFTLTLSSCTSSQQPELGNNDPASYGMAKKTLVQGQTTQQEVLETFGAPNIVTKGTGDVMEVWTYEKVSSEYLATQMDISAGGGGGGGGGSGGGGGGLFGGYSKQKGSTSVRTVTLIIKYDQNEIVQDYRIMETNF